MTRRKRIALMVAGLAIAAYALLAFTVYRALLAAGVSEGEKIGTGSLYALVAGIVFALLAAGVWAALDRGLLRPLDKLAREVRTLVHSKQTERPSKSRRTISWAICPICWATSLRLCRRRGRTSSAPRRRRPPRWPSRKRGWR